MPRPFKPRRIRCFPDAVIFKPAGVPAKDLTLAQIALDEMEAMRLVDVERMDQAEAAVSMGISRATVGRLLESGRHKTAQALTSGQGLVLKPGAAPLVDDGQRGRGHGRRRHRHRGMCAQRSGNKESNRNRQGEEQ